MWPTSEVISGMKSFKKMKAYNSTAARRTGEKGKKIYFL